MIKCTCEQCGGEFPMNDTLRVEGRILCDSCCETVLAQKRLDSPQTEIERQYDPTICANCMKDSGTIELPLLAGLPVCDSCETFFRNRPFPAWIKLALAGVLILVAVSLVWNVRFFRAYAALRQFAAYSQQGQIAAASVALSTAAAYVPECSDIGVLATFTQGIVLLQQEKPDEALEKFLRCRNRMPDSYDVETPILNAQGAAAFDARDYDGFLNASRSLDVKFPSDPMCKSGLASALACKYAVTGDDVFRKEALACLEQAKELAKNDPAFQEYEDRIRYRIHSQEIITRSEFHQRFPKGWNGKEK
ncbi:MAG: hypothetical protein ABFE13_16370 [Phycisphaerales bacterium]